MLKICLGKTWFIFYRDDNLVRFITLTSLRNPIMRLLSRYDFEERWEGGQFGIPMNRTQVWSTRSFEQQVFNHFDVRRYFNHAVKVLACRSWSCDVDQEVFNLAIKVLNSIDLTFIMEWYPDPRSKINSLILEFKCFFRQARLWCMM